MSEHTPFSYVCRCGNTFAGRPLLPPPNWEYHGAELLCDDCIRKPAAITQNGIDPNGRGQDMGRASDQAAIATAILLRSGSYLDLANPDCRRIEPIDIAAGLRQPRFCAQTPQLYTIAQHSLLVLKLVEPIAQEIGGTRGHHLRWCALMHDAAEAFIHDITRPLKCQLADYLRIETKLEKRLFAAFGVEWTAYRKSIIKRCDLSALAIEQRDLLGNTHNWPCFDNIKREDLKNVTIRRCWSEDEAQARFLDAFFDLQSTMARKEAA